MHITPWQMYWITELDNLLPLFIMAGFVLAIVGGVVCCFGFDNVRPDLVRRSFWWFAASAILFCFAALVPSTKEMAAILIVPKIVNNEKVQEIPSKILDLAGEWLDQLRPKK